MQTQVRPRVANAPLSYGAFEITVGTDFQVPDPVDVLGAIGDAGYVGTDLGPPGYLGEGDTLQQRLANHRLDLVGGFVPVRFSEREHWDADLDGLTHTLAALRRPPARPAPGPVLCDAGGPERIANPGRGGDDQARASTTPAGRRSSTASRAPPSIAREAGYEPVFHHHTSSYVEGLPEIERFLEDTEVDLLLDSGHLAVAGGDPVQGLKDWRERVGVVHLKDTRMDVLQQVREERADMISAWRRGLFCALGDGDVDLVGFCAELQRRIRRVGGDRAGPRARRQRRVRPRGAGAARQPRVAEGARRMVSAFDVITMGRIGVDVYPLQTGRVAAPRQVLRQVPRRQLVQRRGRGGQVRPQGGHDHAHGRRTPSASSCTTRCRASASTTAT